MQSQSEIEREEVIVYPEDKIEAIQKGGDTMVRVTSRTGQTEIYHPEEVKFVPIESILPFNGKVTRG